MWRILFPQWRKLHWQVGYMAVAQQDSQRRQPTRPKLMMLNMCAQSPQGKVSMPPTKKERAEDEKLIQTRWEKSNPLTAGEASLVGWAAYNSALKTFNMSKILFGGVLSGGQQRHICVHTRMHLKAPRGADTVQSTAWNVRFVFCGFLFVFKADFHH